MATLFGLARLGRDAELKFTQNGDPIASLALAFSYGKKQDGKRPTQWVDASLWGARAEALAPHLIKGQQVFVSLDDVHVRTFNKQDGSEGFSLTGRVANIEFAGPAPQAAPAPAPAPRRAPAPAPAPSGNYDDWDDAPF